MLIRRNIKLSKANSDLVYSSLVELEFLLKIAQYTYIQFPDVDLKSGTIHQKLKQSYGNIGDARKYISKMIFVEDEDIADESTAIIHEVLQMIMKLDMPTLHELHGNLEKVTKAPAMFTSFDGIDLKVGDQIYIAKKALSGNYVLEWNGFQDLPNTSNAPIFGNYDNAKKWIGEQNKLKVTSPLQVKESVNELV